MLITKKHLSRRTVLKGAGVALALPFLDAMVPAASALAQTAAEPKLRAGFFYLPHGAVMHNTAHGPAMDRWTPTVTESDFLLNAIMAPLESYKTSVLSIGNLENAAWAGTEHVWNPATWLSCTRPRSEDTPNMAVTLDQIAASHFEDQTRVRSLELASDRHFHTLAHDGQAYETLSFRDASSPLTMENDPRRIYLQMFGDRNGTAGRASELRETASLLDLIMEQTRALQGDLGPGDRAVLDDHLEAVRDVELRMAAQESAGVDLARSLADVELPDMPEGPLDAFDEQVKLMFDLIAIAYQADITRVVSFIMAAEHTNQTYNHIGVRDSFHPVSHHANDPERLDKLVRIQTWHMEKFAELLKKMAETPDGQGTLLDHSIFLYGSNMSNSDRHDNYPLPTIVVGGGNGRMKRGGRHVALPDRTPLANLHLTLLNKMGIEQDRFADSTGMISEI
jgi:hypothetical protein